MFRLINRITIATAVLLAVVVAGSVFGGSGSGLRPQVESAAFCPVAIRSEGSTTVFPITRASETPFETLWSPGTDVQLSSIGSSNGINLLNAGQTGTAPSSRPFTAAESSDKYVYKLALDAFVIAVSEDSAMDFLGEENVADGKGLTIDHLRQIYSAGAGINALHWDQLSPSIPGAPHTLIVPRARITGSGSQPDFLSKFGVSAAAEAATIDATGLPRLVESSDMAAAAAANIGQIAYTSLANLSVAGLRAVKLSNGAGPFVDPNPATTVDGSYPVRRELFIGVRDKSTNPRIDNTDMVRNDDWINYLRSPAAQAIISGVGFVPVAPGARPPIPDWDVNMDGGTSLGDLGGVSSRWGQTSSCKGWIRADVNNSGNVSLADIGGVTNKWGQLGFQCVAHQNPCLE